MKKGFLPLAFLPLVFATACNNDGGSKEPTAAEKTDSLEKTEQVSIREDNVDYELDGTKLKSFVAFNEKGGKQPIVLVVPEWWGLTDYPKTRARQLAAMGYLAMAVDIYGEGKQAENPKDAQNLATPFYQNPQLAKSRLEAALAKAKTYAQADTSRTAAIGYCFGGTVVLNAAKLGTPFNGVVSFHGGLEGPAPHKGMQTAVLVCHGGADSFVPEAQVAAFRKSMDSAGVNYTFKVYPGATHAFTNPDATKKGETFKMPIRYNGAADTASWNDMKAFFAQVLR